MTFSTYLQKNRGVIKELKNRAEIIRFWEIKFLSTVSLKELELFDRKECLWHACKDHLVSHFEGHEANQKFNNKIKNEVIVFYQDKNDCYYVGKANDLAHHDLTSEATVYVVDTALRWSYIKTNNRMHGPYFIEA